jgi:hypothetical protein
MTVASQRGLLQYRINPKYKIENEEGLDRVAGARVIGRIGAISREARRESEFVRAVEGKLTHNTQGRAESVAKLERRCADHRHRATENQTVDRDFCTC